ncbi:Vitamin B12 ABC transporter, substrate-binding protein BtuF [hydrothermal vent metagenome]|uniref:Vitamin B12 ABC transporter, substrate-binding protein BtuF n=1 Tax=hydrothermal vent metagenome TaxID=652676 RepID=A0A3B1ART0_9ZZZZ
MSKLVFSILLLICPLVSQGAELPNRIVSINLCTDQLLLMLADPEQISSISYLALEPNSSFMAKQAQQHQINHEQAEELLALKPSLILADEYSDQALISLMKKLNYQVEIFPPPATIEGIHSNITRMAKLLGQEARGQRLIEQMNQRLERVARQQPAVRPKALFYQPNGYTSGKNTLQDTALRLAGWRNLATESGIQGYNAIDIETLLLAKPEQLFTSPYAPGSHSLAQHQLSHPALKQITAGREMIEIDYRYWICGGPMLADAVEQLHQNLPQ